MTARAVPAGADQFTYSCPDCPNFTGTSTGQEATVKELRQHDRNQHPQDGPTRRPNATPEQVEAVRERLAAGFTHKAIVEELDVPPGLVNKIATGRMAVA